MTQRETILCVDDESAILNVLQRQLHSRFGHECEIALAQSGKDALLLMDALDKDGEGVAVVIADQIMPGMKGVELLEEINRRSPLTSKILLTGQAGMEAVVAAINRAELNQYVTKPWDEAGLRLAVENLLQIYRLGLENEKLVLDLSAKNEALLQMNRVLEARVDERTHELADANARLSQLAVTDGLTKLYNHRFLHERLSLEVERSGRNGLPLSLLMIDVDHFKGFNDNFGHPAGDALLVGLAELMGEGRRANDFVARYGGEEFAIVLVDTGKETGLQLGERLRARVEEKDFKALGKTHHITISVGVASFPADSGGAEGLIQAADDALYRAKNGGRNRVTGYKKEFSKR